MSYSKILEERIDRVIQDLAPGNFIAKKMFGGVGYMVQGNMGCGVLNDYLIVRVGKAGYEQALRQTGVNEFMNNNRPMTGWVTVDASVLEDDGELQDWIRKGVEFALQLPKK